MRVLEMYPMLIWRGHLKHVNKMFWMILNRKCFSRSTIQRRLLSNSLRWRVYGPGVDPSPILEIVPVNTAVATALPGHRNVTVHGTDGEGRLLVTTPAQFMTLHWISTTAGVPSGSVQLNGRANEVVNHVCVTDDGMVFAGLSSGDLITWHPITGSVRFSNNGVGGLFAIAVTRYQDRRYLFTADAIARVQMYVHIPSTRTFLLVEHPCPSNRYKDPPPPPNSGVGVFVLSGTVVLAAGSGRIFAARSGSTFVYLASIVDVGTDHDQRPLEVPARVAGLEVGNNLLFVLTSSGAIRILSALGDCELLVMVPPLAGPLRALASHERKLFVQAGE